MPRWDNNPFLRSTVPSLGQQSLGKPRERLNYARVTSPRKDLIMSVLRAQGKT